MLFRLWLGFLRNTFKHITMISVVVYLICIFVRVLSFLANVLLATLPKSTCRFLRAILPAFDAGSRWSFLGIRSYVVKFESLQRLPTVQEGLQRLGMKCLCESYWLRDTLLSKNTGLISPVQKPQVFIPGPKSIPFYNVDLLPWKNDLEAKTSEIREELLRSGLDVEAFPKYLNELGLDYNPFLQSDDQPGLDWKVFYLARLGEWNEAALKRYPKTCAALQSIPGIDLTMVMFSALPAKAWIPPHHGMTNAILRAHLPLIVPGPAQIRVGDETRNWQEGKLMVFDDSFEHEVWNHADARRIVLFFNIVHPKFSAAEADAIREFFAQELSKVPAAQYWDQAQQRHHATAPMEWSRRLKRTSIRARV